MTGTLQQIAEYVYEESGFSSYASERFDTDDRKDIEFSIATALDRRLLRETWVLAGGDPERFSYPSVA